MIRGRGRRGERRELLAGVLAALIIVGALSCGESESENTRMSDIVSKVVATMQVSFPTPTPAPVSETGAVAQAALPQVQATPAPAIVPAPVADAQESVSSAPPASVPGPDANVRAESGGYAAPLPEASRAAATLTPAPALPTPQRLAASPSRRAPPLADVVETVKPSLMYIETSGGGGSGFVISDDGLVVTSAHVVGAYDTVSLTAADGGEYEGVVIGVDEKADLAAVRAIGYAAAQSMALGDSDGVRVGDEVAAIGFPLGYDLGATPTITRGIISSTRIHDGVDVFQTDAAINPGNSGGPLLNQYGEVIGINYAKHAFMDEVPVESIGFSIAVNELRRRLGPLTGGERALSSGSERDQSNIYRNPRYGYSLEIAPDWREQEDASEDGVTFWSGDRSGLLVLNAYDVGRDSTLEGMAQSVREHLERLATEESWDTFEITSFQKRRGKFGDHYRLEYAWRLNREHCAQDNVILIFLSALYPTRPYGFTAECSVCEDNLAAHAETRALMLNSFTP